MRRIVMSLLLGCLASPAQAQAGVYSTVDPIQGPIVEDGGVVPIPIALFRDTLSDRIGLLRDPALLGPNDPPLPEGTLKRRKDHEAKTAALQNKIKTGGASLDDQINLSAYLIGLGKFQDAIVLLEPLARGEGRANFMVLSNLATAYQLAGQPERVLDYLQLARGCWPDKLPGMKDEQLKFYRQVDRLQFLLVRQRRAETAKLPPGVRHTPESVDALFGATDDPIKFVAESAQYEAGKIAAKQKAKLPKDAIASVQQLILWLPDDTRLYWLLGELLNADGQISEAYTVLDECVGARRYDAAELKEHRRILLEGLPKPPPPPPLVANVPKAIIVGGGAVLVIGLLGYLQIRELRRRRS